MTRRALMLTAHPPGRGSGSAVRGAVAHAVLDEHHDQVDTVSFAASGEAAFAIEGARLIPRPPDPTRREQLAMLPRGGGLYHPEHAAGLLQRLRADVHEGALQPRYDTVWCHSSLMARAGRLFDAGVRILDIDNIAAHPARQLAAEPAPATLRLYRRVAAASVAREERRRCSWFDHVLVTSTQERDRLGSVGATVHVVPNTVPDPGPPIDMSQTEPVALFVGSLDYGPNIEAVDWLAREIWPALRDEVAGARLVVAGRSPTPQVQALCAEAGIELLADVPSLDALYRGARAVLAPMRSGGGLGRIKLLEAFSYGAAVVATHQAVEGLDARELSGVSVARDVAGLVASAAALLRDPGQAARAGGETRTTWASSHSPAQVQTLIAQLLDHP
jgi:glycosyltransferase involved in cell wall biosynthesis